MQLDMNARAGRDSILVDKMTANVLTDKMADCIMADEMSASPAASCICASLPLSLLLTSVFSMDVPFISMAFCNIIEKILSAAEDMKRKIIVRKRREKKSKTSTYTSNEQLVDSKKETKLQTNEERRHRNANYKELPNFDKKKTENKIKKYLVSSCGSQSSSKQWREVHSVRRTCRPVPGQTHEAQLSVETFSTSTEDVLALKTPLDGDSLFTAVAHQLQFPVPQLRYGASILRRGAIIQMISSLERYRDLLLESAAVHEDRYREVVERVEYCCLGNTLCTVPSQLIPEDSLILRHLHDLCQPGFPAAIASAQALADSLRVNITILPESGLKYELHGKGSDGRNLYLGLRRVVLDDDNVTTHFDSGMRSRVGSPLAHRKPMTISWRSGADYQFVEVDGNFFTVLAEVYRVPIRGMGEDTASSYFQETKQC
ncbi:hypothetical protein PR048_026844 [Dryococelus australis]|uniref:Uncharacterized protein n=1 Tax=Dryococelus australis TaxID=614101 RepID=A0ABQ9GME3_9NEOP|nr:hypothetical protein PR048_026844 [Dryococelus australis]